MEPQRLLGEDGRGYDLARRLEACGAWRPWLGESSYAVFVHFLSSPASWDAFMRSDDAAAKTRSQICLQLRVRQLLYDKASVCLFPEAVSSASASKSCPVNPAYLQLHADDVYVTLEDDDSYAVPSRPPQSTVQPRSAVGSHYDRNPRPDDLLKTWYDRCADKLKKAKPFSSPAGDSDLHRRTPEGMLAYLKVLDSHKRKRRLLAEDGASRNVQKYSQITSSSPEEDTIMLPEIMFPSNCVPESALPPPRTSEKNPTIEPCGVLDTLPNFISQNPFMVERLGIRPELVKVELARSKFRAKYGSEGSKRLSPEQASQLSLKVVARVLLGFGFDAGTESSLDVLSKLVASHASKLGRTLKILSDSYRRQCSSVELLKMFARTAELSFSSLADHMRETTRATTNHPQNPRGVQSHPNYLQQQQISANQIQRPLHGQVSASYAQNLAFQQQQQQLQLRRRQASLPRVNSMPMVEVKMENSVDSPGEVSSFGVPPKQPMQFRPQQILSGPAHQFRPMSSPVQAPPSRIQSQNSFGPRAAPVKVEGFEELMGGGSPPLKHDEQQRHLTSPSK